MDSSRIRDLCDGDAARPPTIFSNYENQFVEICELRVTTITVVSREGVFVLSHVRKAYLPQNDH